MMIKANKFQLTHLSAAVLACFSLQVGETASHSTYNV